MKTKFLICSPFPIKYILNHSIQNGEKVSIKDGYGSTFEELTPSIEDIEN